MFGAIFVPLSKDQRPQPKPQPKPQPHQLELPVQQTTTRSNGVSVNGRFVQAMRSDEAAKDCLRKIGVDELKFALYENVPYTTPRLFADWLDKPDDRTTVNEIHQKLNKYEVILKRFAGYRCTNDLMKAQVYVADLGLSSTTARERMKVLSYRSVFLLTLSSKFPRGEVLAEILGIDQRYTSLDYLIAQLSPKPSLYKTQEEVERTEKVNNFTSSIEKTPTAPVQLSTSTPISTPQIQTSALTTPVSTEIVVDGLEEQEIVEIQSLIHLWSKRANTLRKEAEELNSRAKKLEENVIRLKLVEDL